VEVFTLRLMNPRGPRDFEINTEKVGSLEQFGKLLDMLGVARLPVWYVVLTKDVGTEVAHPPGLKKKELVHVVDKYMGASWAACLGAEDDSLTIFQGAHTHICHGAFVSSS
jgi:hypothetical protein